MASGHVNRANRPNTWLHRPSLRREVFLANSEPSTHGTSRTLGSPRSWWKLTFERWIMALEKATAPW